MTKDHGGQAGHQDFQGAHAEILNDIARSLIELTPDHWHSATLHLAASGDGISHQISSDENPRDIAMPSMELFGHTRRLELLFSQYGELWKTAKVRVFPTQDGNWSFHADYEYEPTT